MKQGSLLSKLAATAAVIIAGPADAQVVAGAADANQRDDDPVILSPFEVISNTERGYYGANTLSGTRLDSKLEDLGSSITVVTKQQMSDFSTVDINDMFLYEASTEGPGNFTDYSVDRSGVVQDGASNENTTGGNRVRGLSGANIALNGFAMNTRAVVPVDSYNIDAVEISRGPNSNIFGLGEGAGTVNMIGSQARLGVTSTKMSLRLDSNGSFRSNLDINRPIGRKFAFRVLGLYDDKAFKQKPSSDVSRRAQGIITFRPFKTTKLRASFESYHNFSRLPNVVTPTDHISDWIDAGRPTWDPITFTAKIGGVPVGRFTTAQDAQLPRGLGTIGGNPYTPVRFVEGDQVTYWTVARLGNSANPNTLNSDVRLLGSISDILKYNSSFPLFRRKGISDASLYDWGSINATSLNYSYTKSSVLHVDLEQFIVNTPTHLLAMKFGWLREDGDKYNHLYFAGGQNSMRNEVLVDVNEKLLDGSPNPFFLRPYLRAHGTRTRGAADKSDSGRAQLAYQLDLTRTNGKLSWFGRHRVSAFGEFRENQREIRNGEERVLSDHTWTNNRNRSGGTAAGGNASTIRYYLGDNQGANIDYAPAPLYNQAGWQTFYWRNGATGQWISEPALWGETPTGGNVARLQIRTQGLALQNFFFGERLITTFGWRYDRSRSALMPASQFLVLDPTTGIREFVEPNFPPWDEFSGRTQSRGAVLRPLRLRFIERQAKAGGFAGFLGGVASSLSLHYNESDSFTPELAGYNIMQELRENPVSKGKDYGFGLSLMGGKLYFKFNRYDTLVLGKRSGDLGILGGRFRNYDLKRGTSNTEVPLELFAENVISARYAAQGVTPTPEQFQSDVYRFMQLPDFLLQGHDEGNPTESVDTRSHGLELELNYNPTQYWTIKMNATRQVSVDTNLSGAVERYIALRMPVWLSIQDDQGNKWWGPGTDADDDYRIDRPSLDVMIAAQGLPRTQVRKWRFNALTSYNFAGFGGEQKWLKNLTLGGSVRWEDRGSIGFYGAAPGDDGVITSFDKKRPIWDPSRFYVDAFARYRLRLFTDKVRATVQLNIRNLFEDGGLRAVGANPDGSPFAFRIIQPRLFMLTTTFEF